MKTLGWEVHNRNKARILSVIRPLIMLFLFIFSFSFVANEVSARYVIQRPTDGGGSGGGGGSSSSKANGGFNVSVIAGGYLSGTDIYTDDGYPLTIKFDHYSRSPYTRHTGVSVYIGGKEYNSLSCGSNGEYVTIYFGYHSHEEGCYPKSGESYLRLTESDLPSGQYFTVSVSARYKTTDKVPEATTYNSSTYYFNKPKPKDVSNPNASITSIRGNSSANVSYTNTTYISIGIDAYDNESGLSRIEVRENNETFWQKSFSCQSSYTDTINRTISTSSTHIFTIYAMDCSNNSTTSGKKYLYYDSYLPNVSISINDGSSYTTSSSVTVSFSSSDDETGIKSMNVYYNGYNKYSNPSGGAASVGIELTSQGNNTVKIEATDYAGNTGSTTATIYYDPSNPDINISSISYDSTGETGYTNTTGFSISGSGSDSESGINHLWIYDESTELYNGAYSSSALTTPYNISSTDGGHNIKIKISDNAGNTTETSKYIYYDGTNPSVSVTSIISSGSASSGYTHTKSVSIKGTATDNQSGLNYIWIYDGDTIIHQGSLSSTEFSIDANLIESLGNHVITVKVRDKAYNTNSSTGGIYFDNVNPSGSITVTGNSDALTGFTKVNTIKFHPTISDLNSGLATIKIDNGTTNVINNTSLSGNSYNQDIDYTIPGEGGTYTFTMTVIDKAGNSITIDCSIIYDNTAPNISDFSYPIHTEPISGRPYYSSNYYRYIRENSITLNANWKEEYYNSYSLEFPINTNYQITSGDFSSRTDYAITSFLCDISSYPIDFDNQITAKLSITDKAGNTSTSTVSFYKADDSRDIIARNFRVKSGLATASNIIGSKNSNPESNKIYFLYDLIGDTNYITSIRVDFGGNNVDLIQNNSDHKFIKNYLTTEEIIKPNSNWFNQNKDFYSTFTDGQYAEVNMVISSRYSPNIKLNTRVKFDYVDPTISSANYVRDKDSYNSWTNKESNYIRVTARDSSGIGEYKAYYAKNIYNNVTESNLLPQQKDRIMTIHPDAVCRVTGRRTGGRGGTPIYQCTYNVVNLDPYSYNDTIGDSIYSTFSVYDNELANKGSNELYVIVLDNAGNCSVPFKTTTIRYDIVDPKVKSLTKSIKEFTNKNTYTGNVTSEDYQSGVKSMIVKDSSGNQVPISGSNGSYEMKLTGDIAQGIHYISVTVEDNAGNIATYMGSEGMDSSYIYDTVAPNLIYQTETAYVSPLIDYTYNDGTNNQHTASIKAKDVSYYISVDDVTGKIKESDWINCSPNNSEEPSKIFLPDKTSYVYIRVKNREYTDPAGNYISGVDLYTYTSYQHVDTPKLYDLRGTDEYSVMFREINNSVRKTQGMSINDGVISWLINPNESLNINEFNFDGFNNYLFTDSLVKGYMINGVNINNSATGTYAYPNVLFSDSNHKYNLFMDLVVIVVSPILTNKSSESSSVVNLLQGEELTNVGLSFVSPLGQKISTKELITLNGERVDKIDTDIPGTYSIKTSATDLDGRVSQYTRTIIVSEKKETTSLVEEHIEKEIKVNTTKKITSKEVKEEKDTNSKVDTKIIEVVKLDTISKLDTIKGGKESILETSRTFVFNLFSKYFFKVYDG